MTNPRPMAIAIPERVLVVAAHPDDIEYTVAGTVARWSTAGSQIAYLLATDGNKGTGDPTMTAEQIAAIRRAEQRTAAAVVGVREVVFLGYEDGVLEPTLALRRDIVRVIRRFKPTAIVCQDPSAYWLNLGYINHPDHLAVGAACLAAIFPAASTWLAFPELLNEGLEPHRVSEIYLTMTLAADLWIDIGATMEAKLVSWRANHSQISVEGLVDDAIRREAQMAGGEQSVAYAEAFKYFRLGA